MSKQKILSQLINDDLKEHNNRITSDGCLFEDNALCLIKKDLNDKIFLKNISSIILRQFKKDFLESDLFRKFELKFIYEGLYQNNDRKIYIQSIKKEFEIKTIRSNILSQFEIEFYCSDIFPNNISVFDQKLYNKLDSDLAEEDLLKKFKQNVINMISKNSSTFFNKDCDIYCHTVEIEDKFLFFKQQIDNKELLDDLYKKIITSDLFEEIYKKVRILFFLKNYVQKMIIEKPKAHQVNQNLLEKNENTLNLIISKSFYQEFYRSKNFKLFELAYIYKNEGDIDNKVFIEKYNKFYDLSFLKSQLLKELKLRTNSLDKYSLLDSTDSSLMKKDLFKKFKQKMIDENLFEQLNLNVNIQCYFKQFKQTANNNILFLKLNLEILGSPMYQEISSCTKETFQNFVNNGLIKIDENYNVLTLNDNTTKINQKISNQLILLINDLKQDQNFYNKLFLERCLIDNISLDINNEKSSQLVKKKNSLSQEDVLKYWSTENSRKNSIEKIYYTIRNQNYIDQNEADCFQTLAQFLEKDIYLKSELKLEYYSNIDTKILNFTFDENNVKTQFMRISNFDMNMIIQDLNKIDLKIKNIEINEKSLENEDLKKVSEYELELKGKQRIKNLLENLLKESEKVLFEYDLFKVLGYTSLLMHFTRNIWLKNNDSKKNDDLKKVLIGENRFKSLIHELISNDGEQIKYFSGNLDFIENLKDYGIIEFLEENYNKKEEINLQKQTIINVLNEKKDLNKKLEVYFLNQEKQKLNTNKLKIIKKKFYNTFKKIKNFLSKKK